MKVNNFISDVFLRLTSVTCPYGHEDDILNKFSDIFPSKIEQDDNGNYFYSIGESKTIFASHLDTVSKEFTNVVHEIEGDFIKTDGNTTLGADDKAGVTIMLWMIENKVPGLYYFFVGEEVGCIGSGFAAKNGDFDNYDRIISFDRRGTGSVITYQSSGRCCSDDFADDLCSEFNALGLDYSKDDGGIYTDSAEFTDIIKECTNISVGYYKEHTMNESQDIKHLTKLSEACVLVDWENLITKRDPKVYEPKYWNNYSGVYAGSEIDDIHDSFDFDEFPEDTTIVDRYKKNKKRRKRRNKNKKSRIFYDSLGELLEVSQNDDFDYELDYPEVENKTNYTWVIDKFKNNHLSVDELEVIKDQYLDVEDPYDKFFYKYLSEEVVD